MDMKYYQPMDTFSTIDILVYPSMKLMTNKTDYCNHSEKLLLKNMVQSGR